MRGSKRPNPPSRGRAFSKFQFRLQFHSPIFLSTAQFIMYWLAQCGQFAEALCWAFWECSLINKSRRAQLPLPLVQARHLRTRSNISSRGNRSRIL
uniref:Uncharacterized protein n=1 Tax=Kalanchoe fedtschenkoi TaxID=63787 RepID=A0A7N0RI84_KALFE